MLYAATHTGLGITQQQKKNHIKRQKTQGLQDPPQKDDHIWVTNVAVRILATRPERKNEFTYDISIIW